MKIDLRILVVAACFMGIAASVVVIVKNTGKSSYSPFVENITPMGRSTAGRVPSVLQMQVKATGITFFYRIVMQLNIRINFLCTCIRITHTPVRTLSI